jgi:F-type H+-transporting ATPase subunit delta
MADLGIRYANALFGISQESGLHKEYLEQAQLLFDNLKSEEALLILTHPRISTDEKFDFIYKAFNGQIHQDFMGFIRLVISKNREAFLLPALDKLINMIKRYQNQTTARVVSAVPLTDTQAEQLTGILSRKLAKKVDLTVIVDPEQIAGISVHVDGYFVDRTVKTMLRDMKDEISKKIG